MISRKDHTRYIIDHRGGSWIVDFAIVHIVMVCVGATIFFDGSLKDRTSCHPTFPPLDASGI